VNDRGGNGAGCFDIKEMGGYNGVDECGSCRTWKVQLLAVIQEVLEEISCKAVLRWEMLE